MGLSMTEKEMTKKGLCMNFSSFSRFSPNFRAALPNNRAAVQEGAGQMGGGSPRARSAEPGSPRAASGISVVRARSSGPPSVRRTLISVPGLVHSAAVPTRRASKTSPSSRGPTYSISMTKFMAFWQGGSRRSLMMPFLQKRSPGIGCRNAC